jgi:hypothetical protein
LCCRLLVVAGYVGNRSMFLQLQVPRIMQAHHLPLLLPLLQHLCVTLANLSCSLCLYTEMGCHKTCWNWRRPANNHENVFRIHKADGSLNSFKTIEKLSYI